MLTLKRVEIGDAGAFGVLQWHRKSFCLTLERTYRGQGNAQVTKLQPGVYELGRSRYHRGGYETWLVTGNGVGPERRILLHKGNVEEDSEGCILLGEQFGWLKKQQALLASGAAFTEFMTLTADHDRLELTILNV